ncbi:hypothetical protein [Streptomyces californicus]|uniref:hypothetical protein n=1 Tax=Streptomyces californicus TaxID=67351 RepID=UPI0037A1A71E
MHIVMPLLVGAGAVLGGLVLATDRRGAARWVVETLMNPAHDSAWVLRRRYTRWGVEHPQMDFFRKAAGQVRLVRIWGGFVAVFGCGLLVAGVLAVFSLRSH